MNISESSVIKVNPEDTEAEQLQNIENDTATFNLSTISDTGTDCEYSTPTIIAAIKRDLKEIDDKQERLKIRKILLENELAKYESL